MRSPPSLLYLRIYGGGGLVACSRHPLTERPAARRDRRLAAGRRFRCGGLGRRVSLLAAREWWAAPAGRERNGTTEHTEHTDRRRRERSQWIWTNEKMFVANAGGRTPAWPRLLLLSGIRCGDRRLYSTGLHGGPGACA